MLEKDEWIFDNEQLIEEVPNDSEISLNNQECFSEKTMLRIFNYKNRSCFGKFFCCIFCCECPCCINIDPLNEKYYFIRLWNKLTKESKDDSNALLPFQTLINLFAHKNVVEDLKKVRLNPNLYLLESGQRKDLEFYIPQLCNFNLFGGKEQVAQFFFFLCNACYASFFFAHRVYWFMRSFQNIDSKIEHDLKFLNSVFQSENKDSRFTLTNLFVAGSRKYLDYLEENNYLLFYKKKFELIDENYIINKNEYSYYKNIIRTKKIIKSYSNAMCHKALSFNIISNNKNINTINENEKKEKPQISPKNIFINNYSFYTESPVDYAPIEDEIDDFIIINKNEKNINKIDDVNLLSFHSVISFIDDLCKIGRDLINEESNKYKEKIILELTKINKRLPANVYLPFLTNNTRNYIIIHIPVTELKVFKTKERVPFMLVFEMIRLDEILYHIQKEKENIFPLTSPFSIDDNAKSDGENIISINNIIEDNEINKRQKEIKKSNSKEKKKKKDKKKKKKEISEEDDELLKKISESDIELSKQISIYLIEEDKKKENEEIEEDEFEHENENKKDKNNKKNKTDKKDKKKKKKAPKIKKRYSGALDINYLNSSDKKKNNNLITENKFLKYHKLFSSDKKKNNHKRSLSFGSLKDEKKSINNKLMDDTINININLNINEVEIENKNKLDNNNINDNEINTNLNKEEEINLDENLNIENNIMINNLNKNVINNEDEEINNLISKNQKAIYSDDNDSSSEVSDEDPKNQIIRGINIKTIFGEKMEDQKERLQLNSPFKNFKTFNIFKAIIKAGEDLKQEQFATQLIQVFKEIFNQNGVDCWLSSYEVISTGQDCGLVEMVCNSLSMDQIKRKTGLSLKQFYLEYFGNEKKKKYQQGLKNFIRSLAGYSLVCYFLQIKDRHNGNILIDSKGHLIHIDFGFMLSNAPGKGIKFEKAPFKITDEMLELLGGINSENFKEYRKRLIKGYFAIYDNFEKIQKLVEFMFMGQGKYFPCFVEKENSLKNLKDRLRPSDTMSKQQKIQYIDDLLSKSIDNWTTNYYDKFQYYIQGIFY